MNLDGDILLTRVSCFDAKMKELGMDSDEVWLPIAIDLNAIRAVRQYEPDNSDQVWVYLESGESFHIDQPYHELVGEWSKRR